MLARLAKALGSQTNGLYSSSADLSHIHFLLEAVAVLFRFGGQSWTRACQSTELSTSDHPEIRKDLETGKFRTPSKTYVNIVQLRRTS